jgi:hypothetical protein
MDAQIGSRACQIPAVSPHDLCYEASLELFRGFGKQDTFLDHFRAKDLETLFEPERWFGFGIVHAPPLL